MPQIIGETVPSYPVIGHIIFSQRDTCHAWDHFHVPLPAQCVRINIPVTRNTQYFSFFEMESHCVAQAGLKCTGSGDPPASCTSLFHPAKTFVTGVNNRVSMGRGYSPVMKLLLSMCGALSPVPSIHTRTYREGREREKGRWTGAYKLNTLFPFGAL